MAQPVFTCRVTLVEKSQCQCVELNEGFQKIYNMHGFHTNHAYYIFFLLVLVYLGTR